MIAIVSVVVPDILHVVELIGVLAVVVVGVVAKWWNRAGVAAGQLRLVQLVEHVLGQGQVVLLLHLRPALLVCQLKKPFNRVSNDNIIFR